MEYKVVQASPLSTLVEKVNDLISNGWEPLGGITTAGLDASTFYQAMVKK